MMLMACSNPIVYLFDPKGLVKKAKVWWNKRKGEDCPLTQNEANKLMEGSPIDVADNLSKYFSMVATCIFFAPIIPLSIPLCLVGSVLYYLVFKYNLLRRHKSPEMLSRTMGTFFGNFMPYITAIQCVAFLLFIENLERSFN